MKNSFRAFADSLTLRLGFSALLFFAGPNSHLFAQAQNSTKPSSSAATDAAVGFSIETEMLTYHSLDSDSEAIACDVTAYIAGTTATFNKPPASTICAVAIPRSSARRGVIILPFDQSVFADFQTWRTDMQIMDTIVRIASETSATTPPSQPAPGTYPPGNADRGTGSSILSALGSTNPILGAVTSGLALLSSQQTTSAVGGTIQDQAFMDNVSRELRANGVSVLMPSVFTPYAFTSIDPAHSPFLVAYDKLFKTRDLLNRDPTKNKVLMDAIDDFKKSLDAPAPTVKSAAPASPNTIGAPSPATAPVATYTRLMADLSADGLAQALGADPNTGAISDNGSQHILMVKALESGGSVVKSTTILHSTNHYSGGSVGTYALFSLDGALECSGNVYDYDGPLTSKDIQGGLTSNKFYPGEQLIFKRGSCLFPAKP